MLLLGTHTLQECSDCSTVAIVDWCESSSVLRMDRAMRNLLDLVSATNNESPGISAKPLAMLAIKTRLHDEKLEPQRSAAWMAGL